MPSADDAVVRRTKDGWRVGGSELPDLTSAMVLADLLAAELAASDPAATATSARASRAADGDKAKESASTETNRLRTTIGQLEHALMARVRVEQAIGVLAERHRIQPRQAFEQLRNAARSRGRRVIDIATDVVASATNPLLQLPDELSRPRTVNRHGRQARGVLGSEGPAS
ncbi:MAG TPA: ANTAR domain-containing protein [Streptosporangiaceae bacterium]